MSEHRLIDADALKIAIVEEGQKSKRYKIGEFWELNRDEIWNAIDAQQTIEERKIGKWIEDAETYYKAVNERGGGVNEETPFFMDDIACPECLSMFSVIDNETERFKFCPNCGARMGA